MWFHSLKTRQTVRKIKTRNSNGIAASLEYSDKKVEVHHIKREANPLVFDEGSSTVFVSPEDGCVMLVAVTTPTKGKPVCEIRAWEMTTTQAFVSRDIVIQSNKENVTTANNTKTRAIINIDSLMPNISQPTHQTLISDAINNVMAIAIDMCMVCVLKTRKAEQNILVCDVVTVIEKTLPILDLILLQLSKDMLPDLLIGDETCITVHKLDGMEEFTNCERTYVLPAHNIGNIICQEFQPINSSNCLVLTNHGSLHLITSSRVIDLQLPLLGNQGLFAVDCSTSLSNKVTLAVVLQENTIHLYHLENLLNNVDTEQTKALIPYHSLFTTCSIGTLSFLQKGSLVACATTNKTLLMWVGV